MSHMKYSELSTATTKIEKQHTNILDKYVQVQHFDGKCHLY